MMNTIIKNAIEEYQCSGCVCGHNISCYGKDENSHSCKKHVAGSFISNIGLFFLGMPLGFNRLGPAKETKINIFNNFEESSWDYQKFNIPVWKYLNRNNHTFIRGLSPRINFPFVHIFLENCMNKINCLEITNEDIDDMD